MSSVADPGDHPTQPVRSLELGDLSDLGPIEGLDLDDGGFPRSGDNTGRGGSSRDPGATRPARNAPGTAKAQGGLPIPDTAPECARGLPLSSSRSP